ncbi:hypothetical protein [Clostridium sp. E02]|uniref:hypothetical protein n=1 Tax=Clostridium sp. E02 TaxID=2487134 RepID=UPI000F53E4B7|nr:hypothetical protein [Clostridium sp. E02]
MKHIRLGEEFHQMLDDLQEEEKDPSSIAKAIKSVSQYINQYQNASRESMQLAQKLVKIEQEFMDRLLMYL